MCVIADELVNKGKAQGLELGFERGSLLLMKALLKDGRIQFEEAARYLDMPTDILHTKLLELERELA